MEKLIKALLSIVGIVFAFYIVGLFLENVVGPILRLIDIIVSFIFMYILPPLFILGSILYFLNGGKSKLGFVMLAIGVLGVYVVHFM